jgi:hypothetical protein
MSCAYYGSLKCIPYYVTANKHPESLLQNSRDPRSVADAPNMAVIANRAYRPGHEGGHNVRRICAVIAAADALHWRYDHHNL